MQNIWTNAFLTLPFLPCFSVSPFAFLIFIYFAKFLNNRFCFCGHAVATVRTHVTECSVQTTADTTFYLFFFLCKMFYCGLKGPIFHFWVKICTKNICTQAKYYSLLLTTHHVLIFFKCIFSFSLDVWKCLSFQSHSARTKTGLHQQTRQALCKLKGFRIIIVIF